MKKRKIEDEPNRIPAEPIMALVREYLEETGDRFSEGTFTQASLFVFAERVDLKGDTLDHMLRGKQKTLDFDTADRLLCAMNLTDLWYTDLSEVYEKAILDDGSRRKPVRVSGMRVCARRGCSVTFGPSFKNPHKRFCSPRCNSADWLQRAHGVKTHVRGPGRALEALMCKNGHERTPENTTTERGHRRCLVCKREANERQRAKKRAKRAELVSG